MGLEDQVVSLKLAKKLKELGVKQESEFVWIDRMINETETNENRIIVLWKDVLSEWEPSCEILCCAFTPAELGDILPENIFYKKMDGINYACVSYPENYPEQIAETEADARAKMLIYLLEDGLIKI